VVERVDTDPDSAAPGRLRVVQGWGRRRITVSIDEVIEVTPGERRLVIVCREGHNGLQAGPSSTTTWKPADKAGRVRSLVATDPPPNRAGAKPINPEREVCGDGHANGAVHRPPKGEAA
jgi:hypothetical protein